MRFPGIIADPFASCARDYSLKGDAMGGGDRKRAFLRLRLAGNEYRERPDANYAETGTKRRIGSIRGNATGRKTPV
jgi:hypothetical protein